jgi:hypothetical protein
MRELRNVLRSRRGQGTVEAAVLIPTIFLLLLLLCQPAILLYNRVIMENAASEGCRLLVTKTQQGGYSEDKYEGYIKRRLAAIPPLDIFHVRGEAQSWEIVQEGNEQSAVVSVRIVNKLKPLPLLGWGAGLLGMCDERGYLTQEVVSRGMTQPEWVFESGAGSPQDWVRQWN